MIFHNLSINDLYKHAQQMYGITNTEALCAYSGTYTGRCPDDKRISYNNDTTRNQVWWGNVNIDLSQGYRYLQILFSSEIRGDLNFERIIFQRQSDCSIIITLHRYYISNIIDIERDNILKSLISIFVNYQIF